MGKNNQVCDCNVIHEDIVFEVSKDMLTKEMFSDISNFFKILGDDTRCKIIYSLLVHEMCVCDLSNILNMSKSSISHQLSKMKDAGIVKSRRDGKEVYYSLDDNHVCEILKTTITHIEHKERKA